MKTSCPCGNNNSYKNCCKKSHDNILSVKTAEELMRSRYTAFTMGNIDYLQQSWSKETVDTSAKAKEDLKQWTKSVNWVKLEVINHSLGKENDTNGTVKFKAFYYENGELECIHENSFFKRENEHWVYVAEAYL